MCKKYGRAIRLASTVNLPREEWLRIRGLGIGSSDAAAAIGLSPYKSPLSLWLEKTHRRPPDDLSEKEAVIWGTVLEPVLATVYAQRTGLKVRKVNAVLQDPDYPFMLANLDREVLGHPDGTGVLEIKTASYFSAPQWEDGIPVAYQCQVLHQLAVTGHAWADVAVLIGGQDFRIYRIQRDEDKIADLIRLVSVFWQHITNDTQPTPDGSEDAAKALQWLFPRDDGQTLDLSESVEFNQLFSTLLSLRQSKEDVEAQEASVRQQIQNALGNASTAVFQEGRVTWKKSKDRLAPDLDRLTAAYPDLIQQYTKPVSGSRRFVVQAERRSAS
ncbi:YqaJ viral recombinase family nuclease [Iodobacter ciconiae]|uniref:Endonuclease n=1 Tax=Iodobacter ciconiae TaxID=2496266 RepID=A0A3S8ZPV4_9NEIS|nr:YqaJ viral recombinase family protein [Iodobacter ciconiae]AZN35494.1 endonuclease [Iodobacter ciconiae]